MLAADAAAEAGLDVPGSSHRRSGSSSGDAGPRHCRHRRTRSTPAPGCHPTQLADLFATVLGSGEVDAVLVVPVATGVTDGSLTMTELVRARAQHPEIPVVGVPLGGLAGR